MEIIITATSDEIGENAADIIKAEITDKPTAVLGLATGSTPVTTYKKLIRMHNEEGLDFSDIKSFNLDEYYPLKPDHDQSYRYFMNEQLFNNINIQLENTNVPNGWVPPSKIDSSCREYEEKIKESNGIDLQILGIGGNGHIAFNEPGSSLASRTRLVTLTAETISDNARFFESEADVPHHAITMGIGTIMETRKIILLANGPNKAKAVADTIEGPITANVPASALQMHPNAIFIVDEEAASKLTRRGYYQHIQEEKSKLSKIEEQFE